MRNIRKLISVVLAAALFSSVLVFGANASTSYGPLKFNDGKFKILVFSDLHYRGDDEIWEDQLAFMEAALDSTHPDLVVFDGDNVNPTNAELQKECIARLVEPIAQRDIYLALVMGNHDEGTDNPLTREEQIEEFKKYDKCLACVGEDMSGEGNYNLTIADSATRAKFNLWFFDTNNDTHVGGYGYVKKDQIEWYEKTCQSLADENGGKVLPSIVFQHICVPEIYELLNSSYIPAINSSKGNGNFSDRYWTLDKDNDTIEGEMWEAPCPNDLSDGQFDSWLEMGDVQLAVFGHDHTNTFSGEVDGIRLMYAGGAGFSGYHNGLSEACSLITIDEETLTCERELLKYTDLVGTYAASYSFDDYFEYSCWWNLLRLNPDDFIRCLTLAVKALFSI